MRHAVLALALAVSACRCTETTSAVDIPIELEQVRARHAPPDVVVKVEERTQRRGGGGGCGHTPLCVIVLPFMVYDSIFPKRWEDVTVREGGAVTFIGSYESGGPLIEARSLDGERVRYFGRLELAELHQRLYVQLGEATLAADGAVGARQRTPIQPQVDVLGMYRAALAEEEDGDDRADLILEAAHWLGPEAEAFLEARLQDGAEPDASKALVVNGRCEASATAGRAAVVAVTAPGVQTAVAMSGCIHHYDELRDLATAHAATVGALLCEGTNTDELLALAGSLRGLTTRGATVTATCEAREAQLLIDHAVGRSLDEAAAEAAVREESAHGGALARRLSPRGVERRLLFAALDAHPDDEAILDRIPSSGSFSDAELDLIAKSYLVSLRAQRRATTVELFHRAAEAGTPRGAARRRIINALGAAEPKDRPPLHAALMVLGDRRHAAPAAAVFDDDRRPRLPSAQARVYDDEDLVAYALQRMGCDRKTLAEALAKERPTDASRGPLCTKPMR